MLENWLQFNEIDRSSYLPTQIGQHILTLPDIEQAKPAFTAGLIGLDENSITVKEALFQYIHSFPPLQLIDLGLVRKADPSFVIPLVKELLEVQIFPILIGQSNDWIQTQLQAHTQMASKAFNWTLLTDRLQDFPKTEGQTYFLGTQAHLSLPDLMQVYDYENWGLGKVRRNFKEAEPNIRVADLMSLQLSVLKYSELPAQQPISPSGFFLEEVCQLAYYAGMSDQLKSMGLFGFQLKDGDLISADAIAQIIWYFLDGYYNRKQDYPTTVHNLTEYVVNLKDYEHPITFWKSQKSNRWWVEMLAAGEPLPLIPCSYEDYRLASQGDLSDRMLFLFSK